jgi:hypothetical protein
MNPLCPMLCGLRRVPSPHDLPDLQMCRRQTFAPSINHGLSSELRGSVPLALPRMPSAILCAFDAARRIVACALPDLRQSAVEAHSGGSCGVANVVPVALVACSGVSLRALPTQIFFASAAARRTRIAQRTYANPAEDREQQSSFPRRKRPASYSEQSIDRPWRIKPRSSLITA